MLLLGFLLSGRGVYADGVNSDGLIGFTGTTVSYVWDNWYAEYSAAYAVDSADYLFISTDNTYYAYEHMMCRDVYLYIKEKFYFDPGSNYNPNYSFEGFVQAYGKWDITATVFNNYTNVFAIQFIDSAHTFPYSYYQDSTSYTQSTVNVNSRKTTIDRNIIFYLNNKGLVLNTSSAPIYNRTTLHFKIYYYDSGATGDPSITISVSRTNDPTGRGAIVRYDSDSALLGKSLYTQNLILSALQSGNGNVVSAINNASANAHSDSVNTQSAINTASATAHSDSVNTQNILTTDSSGTSTVVSGIENDYNIAQSQADDAVDNAVHNYDNDLDTVENFDFTRFFTSQRNAATFWRDVGEFILDSSNLGTVASGVIITTLITLFVFMLRL